MRNEKLKGVFVGPSDEGDEIYMVGTGATTAVEWGETNGHMASLDTVRVFRDGKELK